MSSIPQIRIPLPHDVTCLVSPDDADLAQYRWHLRSGYAVRWFDRRKLYLHRIILGRILGRALVPGEECDHRDGDPLNNTRPNLRLATRRQQVQNKMRQSNNRSGYTGVAWHSAARKWEAYINVDGKRRYLGLYPTPEEAATAYEHAAVRAFGEFKRG